MVNPPDVKDFTRMLDVNTLGHVRVTRMFLPLIRMSKGRVVIMSSITCRLVAKNFSSYTMSKAAITKFTDVLRSEVAMFGVKVIGIEPWGAKTPMILKGVGKEGFIKAWNSDTPQEVKDAYGQRYYEQFQRMYAKSTDSSSLLEPQQVVDEVVDAVMSPEPDVVYRVVPVHIDWIIWFVFEFLPQDLRPHVISILERLQGH